MNHKQKTTNERLAVLETKMNILGFVAGATFVAILGVGITVLELVMKLGAK